LPIKPHDAAKAVRDFEKESRLKNQTQIFIETPYRNNSLFANLIRSLQPQTKLCLAIDITGEHEFIATREVQTWRLQKVEIPKVPSVFLFLAEAG
jgi:16S rRNA (cytidine1402-2'-O)-methyltransferase